MMPILVIQKKEAAQVNKLTFGSLVWSRIC
jgi:hypothetical protein